MDCLIMAAGSANRFGSCKQLARINNVPMIEWVIGKYQRAGVENISVVLGANKEEIAKHISSDVNVLFNEHWQMGLGSSIAFAVDELMQQVHTPSHILIGLGDQIGISSEDLINLKNIQQERAGNLVASCYHDIMGVPASFPSTYAKELIALTGDEGAKYILKRHAHNVIKMDMHAAAFDIDHPNDLERWTSGKRLGW